MQLPRYSGVLEKRAGAAPASVLAQAVCGTQPAYMLRDTAGIHAWQHYAYSDLQARAQLFALGGEVLGCRFALLGIRQRRTQPCDLRGLALHLHALRRVCHRGCGVPAGGAWNVHRARLAVGMAGGDGAPQSFRAPI